MTVGHILHIRTTGFSGAWYRCACLSVAASKLIFLAACSMLPLCRRNPTEADRKKSLPAICLYCFLVVPIFFSPSTKPNKPLFQRDRKDSLLPSLTAMCSISHTQRHVSVVSKNCTIRVCLHAWTRFYEHNDPPPLQYNGDDEQAKSRTAVRSAVCGCNALTHSIWLKLAYWKLLKAVENCL